MWSFVYRHEHNLDTAREFAYGTVVQIEVSVMCFALVGGLDVSVVGDWLSLAIPIIIGYLITSNDQVPWWMGHVVCYWPGLVGGTATGTICIHVCYISDAVQLHFYCYTYHYHCKAELHNSIQLQMTIIRRCHIAANGPDHWYVIHGC